MGSKPIFALWLTINIYIYASASSLAQIHDEELDVNQIINEKASDPYDHNQKCQLMEIPLCQNVGYNQTMLPNSLGHSTQQDVNSELSAYLPLLESGCSPDLKTFLCTFHAPICFDHVNESNPIILKPCKSLCESARLACSSHFKLIDSHWPGVLNCSIFKEKSSTHTCVGKDDEPNSREFSSKQDKLVPNIPRDLGFVCPKNFELNSYNLYLNGKNYTNCAKPCDEVLLDRSSARIVKITTALLAFVSLLSTTFTCFVFLSNTSRFKYPTKPIIIISTCQLVVAACYLIGTLTSNKIACNDPTEPPKNLPNMEMIRASTMGNKKGICTLQFMVLYFFQMSSMLWWIVMTISFFMIAKLKWAPEAVSSVSRYFHLMSWTIPALLTVYLAVIGNIEGDSLTGTCYASFSDRETTLNFIIIPIFASLIVGSVFLVIGFMALWESREILKREYGKQTNQHDRLIVRIGLFSMLFIIFTSILIYCHHYERTNLNSWMLAWLSRICTSREYSIPCPVINFRNYTPSYPGFILKYVATMAIGIISALFMWSDKKLVSLQENPDLSLYNYRT